MGHIPYKEIVEIQNFFSRHMAAAIFEREGVLAISMGIDSPGLNTVCDTNLNAALLKQVFPEITAFFDGQGVPWSWLVTPFSQPSGLADMLKEKGFQLIDECAVMGMEPLEHISEVRLPEGVEFCEVMHSTAFADWIAPLKAGFKSNDTNAAKFRALTERIPYGDGHAFHHYILYKEGKPIAGGTFSMSNGVARMDNIAVHPGWQGQGYGSMMVALMLREVGRFNIKQCFLDSSKDGVRLYSKLGFKEYYTGDIYSLYNA